MKRFLPVVRVDRGPDSVTHWRATRAARNPRGTTVASQELLNVSYDPPRREYVEGAAQQHQVCQPTIKNNPACNWTSRAIARRLIEPAPRKVIDGGWEADAGHVPSGRLRSDDQPATLPRPGLIKRRLAGTAAQWRACRIRLSDHLDVVVRKGNPKQIKGLARHWGSAKAGSDINAQRQGPLATGKLSFLAAWGQRRAAWRFGKRTRPDFVTQVYRHVPVLDSGARAAPPPTSRRKRKIGDVHLTMGERSHFEVVEAKGELDHRLSGRSASALEPPRGPWSMPTSIAEDPRAAAEAYLKFLYTPEAQEIIGQRIYYRPYKAGNFCVSTPDKFQGDRALRDSEEIAGQLGNLGPTNGSLATARL